MPVISVLMGTYNEPDKKQLALAIDSILGQTFQDFEYIICDDGSRSEFYQWLKKFCSKDSRIRLLHNERNRGLAYTLNRCFSYASGRYLARMDADDISLPQRLEKQFLFLEKQKRYALTGCNAWMLDGTVVWGKRRLVKNPDRTDFLYTSPFIHPAVMMRREVMEQLHGYDVTTVSYRVEDYDFFIRMYEVGFVGHNLQEELFLYRESEKSYKKRKYRFRINECIVRYKGFIRLGILRGNMCYVLKPLVTGLIPVSVMRRYRRKLFGAEDMPIRLEHVYRTVHSKEEENT